MSYYSNPAAIKEAFVPGHGITSTQSNSTEMQMPIILNRVKLSMKPLQIIRVRLRLYTMKSMCVHRTWAVCDLVSTNNISFLISSCIWSKCPPLFRTNVGIDTCANSTRSLRRLTHRKDPGYEIAAYPRLPCSPRFLL